MLNFFSFRIFRKKNFKVILLGLTLVASTSLMIITNPHQHYDTLLSTKKNEDLSGFHITVSKTNANLVTETKTWNLINNNYEDFILNNREQVINETFNDWGDIVNHIPNKDVFSKEINDKFLAQINDKKNSILPNYSKHYFDDTVVGRSIAKKSPNDTKSFGDVYVNYKDSLPEHITNGLFATINAGSNFKNYFSIPYTITPSKEFLEKTIEDRITTIPLNNNFNSTNQSILVILAKKAGEKLLINNATDPNIVDSDNLSYIVLNHKVSDVLNPTKYQISVQNGDSSIFTKDIQLTNNCSHIQFLTSGSDETQVAHQFLIRKEPVTNNASLIVMNEAMGSAKIANIDANEQWSKWQADPETFEPMKGAKVEDVFNNETISVNESSDYQVYGISLKNVTPPVAKASRQYIVMYKNDTTVPSFPNCSSLFENFNNDNKDLLAAFNQYLEASSNNISSASDLEFNAGEFISWFIAFQNDVHEHSYVNYLGSDNANKPWLINEKLETVTIVNHWNVVIIFILIFSLLIIIPVIIIVIRKKKSLK